MKAIQTWRASKTSNRVTHTFQEKELIEEAAERQNQMTSVRADPLHCSSSKPEHSTVSQLARLSCSQPLSLTRCWQTPLDTVGCQISCCRHLHLIQFQIIKAISSESLQVPDSEPRSLSQSPKLEHCLNTSLSQSCSRLPSPRCSRAVFGIRLTPHLPLPADEDPLRLLPCDSCDCQTHSYCLQPALAEILAGLQPFCWICA